MSAKANEDLRSKRELLEEMERLLARLDEAEQTLAAIRSGDVDAVVVAGPNGDRIFSLTGAERSYRLIVETMNESALTVGFDGTILFCNRRFCDLVKSSMRDTIGKKLTSFVSNAQHQPLLTLLAEAQTGPVQRRFTLRAADSSEVSVQLAASLLVADAHTSICLVASELTELEAQASSIRVLREQQRALEESRAELQTANASLLNSRQAALIAAEDAIAAHRQAEETSEELRREVAERKRAEEAMQRAKGVAETATRAKSQFLANMSHELRTPMTGVLGLLDLVLFGNLEAEQREFIEIAKASAFTLLRILNDILDLSKIEMGKLSIKEEPFSIRMCVENTFNILLPVARSQGLDFTVTVADDAPQIMIGDQERINQVLMNLAGNAVKFTGEGHVELRVAAGGSTPDGKREITFIVTDTGIGIPEDKRHLLFRVFSQVDESHTREYGGTGLGLAISKEIVEGMGGTITFTSEEGKGSTFSFTIPLAEARKESTGPSMAETQSIETTFPSPEGEMLILLAEDDPIIRKLLGLMLKRSHYEVDFAENGQIAVEMWEKGDYDLVLMDIQMPLINGFEATRAIREKEREGGCHTPIIAMTAHASKEDEQLCLDAGMDAFITKPIDFEKTLQVIGKTLK